MTRVRRPATVLLAWALVALVVALGSCGVPSGGDAVTVPPGDVPYVMSPSSTAPAPTPPTGRQMSGRPWVVFVTRASRLVAIPSRIGGTADRVAQLGAVLDVLALGPSRADRHNGISTEIPPGSELTVRAVRNGVAEIEWRTLSDGLEPRRGTLAAGQVVLSATSVDGVEQVLILRDGASANVPLPGGELKTGPLNSTDFESLVGTVG